MGLQIPSFTYPDVGSGDLFESISDIAVAQYGDADEVGANVRALLDAGQKVLA